VLRPVRRVRCCRLHGGLRGRGVAAGAADGDASEHDASGSHAPLTAMPRRTDRLIEPVFPVGDRNGEARRWRRHMPGRRSHRRASSQDGLSITFC